MTEEDVAFDMDEVVVDEVVVDEEDSSDSESDIGWIEEGE